MIKAQTLINISDTEGVIIMDAIVLEHNIEFMKMVNTMNREILGLGISIETAEIVLGEALDDVSREGSVYVYTENVPNYNDGGTEMDISFTTDLPVSNCIWEIKMRKDVELYTITKFQNNTQQLNRTIKCKEYEIEHLNNKVKELQDIIVQMMINRETSDPTGIKVSEDTFVELVNKFNGSFLGKQNDDAFYNAEYTMSFKGLTTTMGQCPALFDMFERWEQEYL